MRQILSQTTSRAPYSIVVLLKIKSNWDFLGGRMGKNLPASAGDTGLIPGPGGCHMQQGN